MTFSALIILAIAALSYITVFQSCFGFILACRAKEEHHATDAPSQVEDKTAYESWLKTGDILERKRERIFVVGLIAFPIAIVSLAQTPHPTHEIEDFITLLVILIEIPFAISLFRAIDHNTRIEEIDSRRQCVAQN